MFDLSTLRDKASHDLTCSPGHGRNSRDTQALVDLGSSRIVDPGHYVFDAVGFSGRASGDDICVITAAHRGEGMGHFYASCLKGLSIKPDPFDRLPTKLRTEAAKGLLILVDDGYGMPTLVKAVCEQCAYSACPENHDVHDGDGTRRTGPIVGGIWAGQCPEPLLSVNVSLVAAAKRVMFGRALRSDYVGGQGLPRRIALPVFASDALSSNAYATQEILIVLGLGGVSLLAYGPWVAIAVVAVFAVVIASYRQNVREFPSGGGDYEVVSVNLGRTWGVTAASALLIDYVLTVAVSVSAAVAAIGSVSPLVSDHSAWWAIGLIIAITLINLRGWGRSGRLLAVPSYVFMGAVGALVVTAVVRVLLGDDLKAPSADWEIVGDEGLAGIALLFVVARAFSSGTTALTGIETVSNGVPAFREPAGRNAASTLLIAGVASMVMFVSITWLALYTDVRMTEMDADLLGLPEGQTQQMAIVQIAEAVFGSVAGLVIAVAIATALILIVAANTAFNGFPILGSLLSRDGYLPKQLRTRGDRLAFSNGIVLLAAGAALLTVAFQADLTSLIQLYIVGVFVSFSLTQLGMIRHWTTRLRADRMGDVRRRAVRGRLINAVGFLATTLVLVVVLVTKFTRGAWIVIAVLPILVLIMLAIQRHYDRVRHELAVGDEETMVLPSRVHSVVLVSRLHRPTLRALAYARATRPDVLEAITVSVDPEDARELLRDWDRREIPVTLRILDSPYRGITRPVIGYVRRLRRESPRDLVTVFVPEYVVGHWWERLLHNQSALRLKARLLLTPGVMIVSVPWQLASSDEIADRLERADGDGSAVTD